MIRLPIICLVLAGALCLLAGCGTSGPLIYNVHGQVTFQGKPVPKGFIKFLPDPGKGNSGPGGGAEIVNGSYSTPAGKGVQGGAYYVEISGYTGVETSADGETLPDGESLFPPYRTTVDLPKESTEQNFEVK